MPEETQPQDGNNQQQTPPWGTDDDFKPDKAWSLIQNLRGELGTVKGQRDEFKSKAEEWAAFQRESQPEADRVRADLTAAQEQATRWQNETQQWRTTAVTSRVQALAGDFADPTDAASVLNDPNKYLSADGQINDEAIKADLAGLLEQKPHWRRSSQQQSGTPAPNRSQGAGGSTSTDPAQQFASIVQGLGRGT